MSTEGAPGVPCIVLDGQGTLGIPIGGGLVMPVGPGSLGTVALSIGGGLAIPLGPSPLNSGIGGTPFGSD